ncbi:glycoprotein 3-alpha-L-fucosyltransferase A-like isoform X1 [Ruditapes philippinarum]|uniref:glycoprotein 3-alpha-L-fucosyltransferase A-like isoform X1 n=1 Tax=Ruditapes philippinarum TaxID=129788 RepID=UPI00295A6A27|nr:glycoprotein 3-alpha-L-fucosyltransferase A-like isoform X1 [Ruditapes philippinarum]
MLGIRLTKLKGFLLLTISLHMFVLLSLWFLKKPSNANEVQVQLTSMGPMISSKERFRILWYNPSKHFTERHADVFNCGFEKCKYNNCDMTVNTSDANISQAIIFDGRRMPEKVDFTRPNGQIWIFAAHETPISYKDTGTWWYSNKDYSFNWTMTYDKDNSDIYLPYGEILKHKTEVIRDYESISQKKNKTLLIIVSHCNVRSKRQEYVNKLKKYVDVEVLGLCGKKWTCGTNLKHDEDCFKLLNTTYRFYLAFENAFCHQYITEKFYDNFNYDLITLVRGGSPGETKQIFPKGTFVSTDEFESVQDLAHFLKHISVETYAAHLKRKSQYYSAGYLYVYQRAMCNLCERMNNQSKYAKTITDIKEWAYGPKPCIDSKDVTDVR